MPAVRRLPPSEDDLAYSKKNGFQKFLIRFIAVMAMLSWLGTLAGLLYAWGVLDDREVYKWYLGSVPYISDVGAVHKSFFATGCLLTSIFLILVVCSERYLRSQRILVEATMDRKLWVGVALVDIAVVLFSSACLILLSWFDAFDYPQEHNFFMNGFIVGIAVSGALQTVEVEHLYHEHPDRADLRDGTILKWIFLVIAVACGASFWILYTLCDGNALVAYLCTLIMDVWPAYRHAPIRDPAYVVDRRGTLAFLNTPSAGEGGVAKAGFD
ncbi:hypothetical protein MNV49_006015, partial [Pseudohyphozyma bogoriensis]